MGVVNAAVVAVVVPSTPVTETAAEFVVMAGVDVT